MKAFRTKRFEQIYLDAIKPLGPGTGIKKIIFEELYQHETKWLANMDAEYNEAIAAQEAMERGK
jgi:hypothetical protein